jgi:uncharacterized protein
MRILYDSNVLVQTLSRRESILTFKKELVENGITHVSSRHILSEVEAVLREKMNLTRQKSKAAVRLLERQSLIVNPKNVEAVSRDPFDDYVIAAAITAKVKYLITEDEDLLVFKRYRGVDIVTPHQFRSRIDK